MRSIIIVLALFSSPVFAQDAWKIINRYLDTVSNGEIKNWYKIKPVFTEYESYYSQQQFDQTIAFVKADKPSFWRSYQAGRYKKRSDSYEDSTFAKWQSTFYILKDKTVMKEIDPEVFVYTKKQKEGRTFFGADAVWRDYLYWRDYL